MNRNYKDIAGQRFGKFIVMKRIGVGKFGMVWLCRCDCGKLVEVSSNGLVSGNTKSCGCLKMRCGESNPRFIGYKEISGRFWQSILRQSESRRLEVDITKEYIWDLFIKQDKKCALTDLVLEFNKNAVDRSGTASLDRIDSSKGYIKGNVQWVHKNINEMKWDIPQRKFINYCLLVAKKFENLSS